MISKKQLIVFIILMACGNCFADTVRFAVVADTQGELIGERIHAERFAKIVDGVMLAEPKVDFVVQVGDLISGAITPRASYEDWTLWRQIAGPWYESDFFGAKVYPVPGNHDQLANAGTKDTWQRVFSELPDNGPDDDKKMTYSFEYGQCHFAVVNTSKALLFERHMVDNDWLEADLTGSDKPVRFVFGHEPAYPETPYIASSLDTRPEARDQFWSILQNEGVSAYFCGHRHYYDVWIKDDVFQIICGTGGAEVSPLNYLLVDVADDNSITVSVYNAYDNSLMDQFNMADKDNVSSEPRDDTVKLFFAFIDDLPCFLTIILPALLLTIGLRLIRNDV